MLPREGKLLQEEGSQSASGEPRGRRGVERRLSGKGGEREGRRRGEQMKLKDRYLNLIDKANDAMARLEFDTDSQAMKVATAVAIGIGVTAFAGVAVAAAVGGFVLFHERGVLRGAFEGRPKPLSPDQWRRAFEPEFGRLKGGGEKLIGRVRKGGCDPNIRGEVWPFLLGLYDGNSTQAEREAQRVERKRQYEELRHRCKEVGARAQEEEKRRLAIQRAQDEEIMESRKSQKAAAERKDVQGGKVNDGPLRGTTESAVEPLVSEATPLLAAAEEEERLDNRERQSELERDDVDRRGDLADGDSTSDSQKLNSTEEGSEAEQRSSENGGSRTHCTGLDSPAKVNDDGQFLVDFATWCRIMRLDAVRMNAAWIPYSSQAPTAAEEAACLAAEVGLMEDAHLEPSRRHHAARLVAILEAYALHDPEIGYCQGMSDLLSPFVALIEDDSDAFWCYESFMKKARQNFRLDEIGIRKQLESVSLILRRGDPELFAHLQYTQTEDCIFVYRMIVVLLRRELSFEQTLGLWEVIWADAAAAAAADAAAAAAAAAGGVLMRSRSDARAGATSDLLLFVIGAIIRQRRKEILACGSVDEILRLCNSFTGKLDVWSLIDEARSLVAKVGTAV